MLVTLQNFAEEFSRLTDEVISEGRVAFDTETTALFWWQSPHYAIRPRVFSLQFSTANTDYYFDFGAKESTSPLGDSEWEFFRQLFTLPDVTWYAHNAKFDMHHLANHGVDINGTVHCTLSIQRVVNNLEDRNGFSLDAMAEKYLGEKKISLAEYWDDTRKTVVEKPGRGTYDFLHYDRLPLHVLVEYGERDTRLCYRLGRRQVEELARKNRAYFGAVQTLRGNTLETVYANECELTKTLFHVERSGVQLDLPFVKAAHAAAMKGVEDTLTELDAHAAGFLADWNLNHPKDQLKVMDWNSGPRLKALFDFLGQPYAYTEKGRASFDEEALRRSGGPLGQKILTYRRHSKRARTYLENYLWLADKDGVLHCSFAQAGTETGRLSCREPNMQNVPKRADKKETDFVLRKCFVPRPGHALVSMDLDQAEYRLMLDYAGETKLIDRILKEGVNVHEATRLELGLSDYDEAKTMNFKILYGSGLPAITYDLYPCTITKEELSALCKLHVYKMDRYQGREKDAALVAGLTEQMKATNLVYLNQGKAKLDLYFQKLPNVQAFMKKVKAKAKTEGHIFTWLGRVLRYDVKNEWGGTNDYKAPNGLCQGGIGDLGKLQLNQLHAWLNKFNRQARIVLHVHDEVLAEVPEKDVNRLVPKMVAELSAAYPHRYIPITAGAAVSNKSWGDLEDFTP